VFRDLGYEHADAEHLKAILAAEIIKTLNRKHLTVRAAHGRAGFSRARPAPECPPRPTSWPPLDAGLLRLRFVGHLNSTIKRGTWLADRLLPRLWNDVIAFDGRPG